MSVVAQVGCGYWGPNLLRVFRELPGCRLKWLCDKKPGRLEWARERFPGLSLTAELDVVLRDPEVDAVVIATEVYTHHAIALAALKAGKHVFIEKPLAHSSREAADIAAVAKARRRTVGVGHVFLYNAAYRALKVRVGPQGLGRLLHVDFARVNPGPPEPRHDVLWDMAPHDVAMAVDLAGGTPVSVRCTGVRRSLKLDEAAFVELKFKGGAFARIHVSWLSHQRIRRVEAYCEKGTLFFDDALPTEKLKVVHPGEDTRVGAGAAFKGTLSYGQGRVEIPELRKEEPLAVECADFLDAVREGRSPRSGAALGVAVVRVLEAAAKSSKAGGKEIKLS
jgi:predicted dehydrogenase